MKGLIAVVALLMLCTSSAFAQCAGGTCGPARRATINVRERQSVRSAEPVRKTWRWFVRR